MLTPWPMFHILLLLASTSGLPLEVDVGVSAVSLLSGGIQDCPTPRAATCKGGLAAHLAYVRARHAPNRTVIAIPFLDTTSQFVQMHPLSWGVNALVMDELRIPAAFTQGALFKHRRPGVEWLWNASVRVTVLNCYAPPSNPWSSHITRWHVTPEGIAFSYVSMFLRGECDHPIASAQAAIYSLRHTHPEVKLVVLGTLDVPWPTVRALATGVDAPDVLWVTSSVPGPGVAAPGHRETVQGVALYYTPVGGSLLTLHIRTDGAAVVGLGHSYKALEEVDPAAWDAGWDRDQALLRREVARAVRHDPVVGFAATPMPIVRDGRYRRCYSGECAIANLFGDAMLWHRGEADFSMHSAAAFFGPGWAAGVELGVSPVQPPCLPARRHLLATEPPFRQPPPPPPMAVGGPPGM